MNMEMANLLIPLWFYSNTHQKTYLKKKATYLLCVPTYLFFHCQRELELSAGALQKFKIKVLAGGTRAGLQ